MDVKPLLDLTCAKVASMIKGKTPEQIRKTFNIVNDFTPEEEEAVRAENKWYDPLTVWSSELCGWFRIIMLVCTVLCKGRKRVDGEQPRHMISQYGPSSSDSRCRALERINDTVLYLCPG